MGIIRTIKRWLGKAYAYSAFIEAQRINAMVDSGRGWS